jgi:hypothetical protein
VHVGDEDVLRQSRQYFIDRLAEKTSEIRPLIQRILHFDQDLNEATDVLAIIMGGDSVNIAPANSAGAAGFVAGASGRTALRPDEFTGKPYSDSAKAYLERVGHAVSMEELLDALKRGGSPVGGKTPKKTLYISIVRAREVVPIPGQNGFVGLRKWYPNLRQHSSEKKTPSIKKGKK